LSRTDKAHCSLQQTGNEDRIPEEEVHCRVLQRIAVAKDHIVNNNWNVNIHNSETGLVGDRVIREGTKEEAGKEESIGKTIVGPNQEKEIQEV
jgi:hypothetical protein